MQDHEIEELELSIDTAKETIAKMESVLKLANNVDFKKVVDEGYFEKEASRLVLLKADPSLQKEEDQNAIIKSIDAIGYFRQYLQTVVQLGRMAENSLQADQQTREEIYEEAL